MNKDDKNIDHKDYIKRISLHSDLILFLSKVDPATLKTSTTRELVDGFYVNLDQQTLKEDLEGDKSLLNLKEV